MKLSRAILLTTLILIPSLLYLAPTAQAYNGDVVNWNTNAFTSGSDSCNNGAEFSVIAGRQYEIKFGQKNLEAGTSPFKVYLNNDGCVSPRRLSISDTGIIANEGNCGTCNPVLISHSNFTSSTKGGFKAHLYFTAPETATWNIEFSSAYLHDWSLTQTQVEATNGWTDTANIGASVAAYIWNLNAADRRHNITIRECLGTLGWNAATTGNVTNGMSLPGCSLVGDTLSGVTVSHPPYPNTLSQTQLFYNIGSTDNCAGTTNSVGYFRCQFFSQYADGRTVNLQASHPVFFTGQWTVPFHSENQTYTLFLKRATDPASSGGNNPPATITYNPVTISPNPGNFTVPAAANFTVTYNQTDPIYYAVFRQFSNGQVGLVAGVNRLYSTNFSYTVTYPARGFTRNTVGDNDVGAYVLVVTNDTGTVVNYAPFIIRDASTTPTQPNVNSAILGSIIEQMNPSLTEAQQINNPAPEVKTRNYIRDGTDWFFRINFLIPMPNGYIVWLLSATIAVVAIIVRARTAH